MENWIKTALKNREENIENSGISPIVFHATSLMSAINIIKTNQFYLTFMRDGGNDDMPDKHNKYYFFMSTARTRNNRFFRNQFDVVFELDGRKLASNYKGVSHDFWGETERNVKEGDYEQEDRILSTKSTINNALKYIKSVSFFIARGAKVSPELLETIKILNKQRIPTLFYRRWQHLKTGNKTQQVPLKDLAGQVDHTMLTDDDEIDKELLAERYFFADKLYALMAIYESYKKSYEQDLHISKIKPNYRGGDIIKVGREYKNYIEKPMHEVHRYFSRMLKSLMTTPKDKKAQTDFAKFLRSQKLRDINDMFSEISYFSVTSFKAGNT